MINPTDITSIFSTYAPPFSLVSVFVPAVDEDEQEPRESGASSHGAGLSFIIEYVDSKGRSSARRITVGSAYGSTHQGYVTAYCHERCAVRTFRVDRIKALIDLDGVVIDDKEDFLISSLGMSPGDFREDVSVDDQWKTIVAAIRTDAYILTALARIDGHKHEAEISEVVGWCIKKLRKKGISLSIAEEDRLALFISRCRPVPDQVAEACEWAMRDGPDFVLDLLTCAVRVMNADGVAKSSEIKMINDISRTLIGIPIV